MPTQEVRHLSHSIHPVRRHEGDSFARQVAYIGRTTQLDPRTGTLYDYSRDDEPEADGIVGWNGDIDSLVKAVVSAEPQKRSKVVEGRISIVALPAEFNPAQRLNAAKKYARYLADTFGVGVVGSIHHPPKGGNERNWHAHFLVTARVVLSGALGPKTRLLDTLKTGPQLIEALRAWWCGELNAMLREAGHAVTIEHKSFARLGIQTEPSQHKGETLTAIARRRELKESWLIRPLSQPEIGPGVGPAHNLDLKPPQVGSEPTGSAIQGGQLPPAPVLVRPLPVAPKVNPPGLERG